jgi:HSP20 family protein
MTLVRWQPFRNVTSLQREMDRLFENVVARDEDVFSTAFTPAAEIHTDRDNVYLQLEVPGLQPEQIEVQVNAYSVVINGERQEAENVEGQGIKRSEFRYGKLHRQVNLPVKVQLDLVQAKYEHGILKLTLPKAEDEKNKTVKVAVEA